MQTTKLPKLGFYFKGFPEDVRFRRHTIPESLEIARGTLYETWYRCLKLSPYTKEGAKKGLWRSEEQQLTYQRFGDLADTTFDSWWVGKGFELFKEKGNFKRIDVLKDATHKGNADKLLLEIPLTVSPVTLKVQFDRLLRLHHPQYNKFDRWRHSTADEKLNQSRLTSVSLNLYISVYEHWNKQKNAARYKIGEEMSLNPRYVVKHGDLGVDVREKHLQMSLLVTEYLKKGKNLIAHASEGRFPCTDDHEWIERSTRVRRSRYGD
jgi:hypothetical protein